MTRHSVVLLECHFCGRRVPAEELRVNACEPCLSRDRGHWCDTCSLYRRRGKSLACIDAHGPPRAGEPCPHWQRPAVRRQRA